MAGFDNRLGFCFGDIIVASYAIPGQEEPEAQPCVIVSSSTYNQQRDTVLVMAITVQSRPNATSGEMALQAAEAAGLERGAVFRPMLATVEQRRVRLILGRLDDADRQRLRYLLDLFLGR
jgi:mRNA-degrading endonuclease toxin of MazEF toxin-antitoxin module